MDGHSRRSYFVLDASQLPRPSFSPRLAHPRALRLARRNVSGRSLPFCNMLAELDLKTLVWTRGTQFRLDLLASRMGCPKCGRMRVRVRSKFLVIHMQNVPPVEFTELST